MTKNKKKITNSSVFAINAIKCVQICVNLYKYNNIWTFFFIVLFAFKFNLLLLFHWVGYSKVVLASLASIKRTFNC